MAGNIQPDQSGDIYVEFDYNNIIIVDPNRIINKERKISERLVDHENLVMYVNLEADVLPRTKLATGGVSTDRIQTISVAKMNFLRPTKDTFLGSGYYDELTGKNTTEFQGDNQGKEILDTTRGNRAYKKNTVRDEQNVKDNGMLGITSIEVTTNSSFVPAVTIQLEDVQGKGLFQLGDNSPYAAFFNIPHPQFYLTLKGYYGQAVRYQLNLEKFSASYNSFSGNYQVRLDFRGYKFNILNEVLLSHLIATPHMYGQTFTISTNPEELQTSATAEANARVENKLAGQASNSKNNVVTQISAERGYQKIKEVYTDYKSKGLVPIDLPELTLVQLMNKLENFENFIVNSYPKANIEPLTNIRDYKSTLKEYYNLVRSSASSWFNKFLNPDPIVLNNKEKVFVFRKNLDDTATQQAISELKALIDVYNTKLDENPTLGVDSESKITNTITYDTFLSKLNATSIDWRETTIFQTGILNPSEEDKKLVELKYPTINDKIIQPSPNGGQSVLYKPLYTFEGVDRFNSIITSLDTQANQKLGFYETKISADLAKRLEDSSIGLGFKPTVRNMIGVIMASAEAFIRLMDEVHTKSWEQKYNPVRKQAILNNPSSAPSSETKGYYGLSNSAQEQNQGLVTAQTPVYPWPQFFVEKNEDKKARFQLTYLGDPSVVDITNGYNYDAWPEVEFVEEYLKGLTQKFNPPLAPPILDNQGSTVEININAIEFPQTGIAYLNKSEIKYFYEIWERQFLTSHYSNLIRGIGEIDKLIELNIETEASNIVESLGLSSPFITFKLKNYGLSSSTYVEFLRNISNSGTGRAYQDYIRDFYVTTYIKNATEKSFAIYDTTTIGRISLFNPIAKGLDILAASDNNIPLIIDTYPFTDSQWVSDNMVNSNVSSGDLVYQTKNVLTVYEQTNTLANFSDIFNFTVNRPVTSFSYLNVGTTQFLSSDYLTLYFTDRILNSSSLYPTEGYVNYINPTENFTQQTTSILNTPYFVNAIQLGVQKEKDGEKNPYDVAAYLFLNSLPLASLREKYKTLVDDVEQETDYISSVFKKYGAIHKIPYVWILKLGSIWYRYKKYITSKEDILDEVWKPFDYVKNFSPIQNTTGQTYTFDYSQSPMFISLSNQQDSVINVDIGFYPKVISDMNYFYNGFDLFTKYTDEEVQNAVNEGMKIITNDNSQLVGITQGSNTIFEKTRSVLLPKLGVNVNPIDCNPIDNTKNEDYYIIPSFGTKLNQSSFELIKNLTTNPTVQTNLTSNAAVYNGSVRTFWAASQFGYFQTDEVSKPKYDEYLNKFTSTSSRCGFRINLDGEYSKIEEIFSVFDKKILDSFENEFLNFAKPLVGFGTGSSVIDFEESLVDVNADFKNFQSLFKSLMTVPPQQSTETQTQYLDTVTSYQLSNLSNKVKSFLEYDVLFKYGNPSNYDRRLFDSYRSYLSNTQYVVDPITFNPYVLGTLPSKTSPLPLSDSKNLNPDAWESLELEVGFSTIPDLVYTDNGSYITDFFIDNNIEFSQQNVTLLAPLVKMYATQKLKNNNLTEQLFKTQLTEYLDSETQLQNLFLDGILKKVNKDLPDQQQLPEKTINSVVDSQVSKIEFYETFKALNDKWVAGGDFSDKTLFEDVLFLDRASRNIGDVLLLNIFDLKNILNKTSLNESMSVLTLVSEILYKNNFTIMNLPAYVNFYNVQDVSLNSQPQPEGSLEFANNMWGTFLNVDYRKSAPKLVCFFVGKPSEYLEIQSTDYRFRNDGFEITRLSESPLIEDQQNKTDWALSNKCVGFNVDIGIRNQNIFYSFNVSQEPGKATSESFSVMLDTINQATGRNTATQNVGLYNFYKTRSYQCTIECLGNAMIQPVMYFNLRHVPMFNGPYMITDVKHSIQPGTFTTSFTGVRQGIYDLPSIDNFLQQINQNLLTKLQEIVSTAKDDPAVPPTTDNEKADNTKTDGTNTKAPQNSCTNKLNEVYATQVGANAFLSKNAVLTKLSPTDMASAIRAKTGDNTLLAAIIYQLCYIGVFENDTNTGIGSFNGFDNNFAGITLDYDYGQANEFFVKTYSCLNLTPDISSPIANFESVDKFLDFMISRLSRNERRIAAIGTTKYYCCYWPFDKVPESYFDANYDRFSGVTQTINESEVSALKAGLITEEEAKNLKITNEVNTPILTPSVPTESELANTTSNGGGCPPPAISKFSPLTGTTGQIMQISGYNLLSTTGVTINNVEVDMDLTQIFNDEIIRVTVPSLVDDIPTLGKIQVRTKFGTTLSQKEFLHI